MSKVEGLFFTPKIEWEDVPRCSEGIHSFIFYYSDIPISALGLLNVTTSRETEILCTVAPIKGEKGMYRIQTKEPLRTGKYMIYYESFLGTGWPFVVKK